MKLSGQIGEVGSQNATFVPPSLRYGATYSWRTRRSSKSEGGLRATARLQRARPRHSEATAGRRRKGRGNLAQETVGFETMV